MIRSWFNERFVIISERCADDGYGGERIVYSDGPEFLCGFSPAAASERSIAEQPATASEYSIAFDQNVSLEIGMKIKRVRDGAVFEVLNHSDDYSTPATATPFMAHSEAKIRRVTMP